MTKISITINGSRSGDAKYNLEMDEGEILALKMALAEREKLQKPPK